MEIALRAADAVLPEFPAALAPRWNSRHCDGSSPLCLLPPALCEELLGEQRSYNPAKRSLCLWDD